MSSSGSSDESPMESTVTSASSEDEISFTTALMAKATRDLLNQFRIELSNDNRFRHFLQVVIPQARHLNMVRQEVSNLFPNRPDLVEAFNRIFPDKDA